MAYKIGVFGSAGSATSEIMGVAEQLGKAIADNKCILITGGCGGFPHAAAKGSSKNGGKTLAYSPGRNMKEHKEDNGFPTDGYTDFVFVPDEPRFDNKFIARKFRNVMSCADSDAGILIGGRIGTLNEFTNLYDMGKVIGVLEGTGGVTTYIKQIIKTAAKETGAVVVYDNDPVELVNKIIKDLDSRK